MLSDGKVVLNATSRRSPLCRHLSRFVGHLPGADTSATSCQRPRAGVPQSSGEETAASAEVVVAAYGAMAIRWPALVLAAVLRAAIDLRHTATAPPA